jgi:hypothetical protein
MLLNRLHAGFQKLAGLISAQRSLLQADLWVDSDGQRQLYYQLFQLRVLFSKLPDLAYLIHFQTNVLRLPRVKRLFRNLCFAN